MMLRLNHLVMSLAVTVTLHLGASAEAHRLLVQGNDKLAIVAEDGKIEWQMPWGAIHDVHRLANGNFMVQSGAAKVVEIDPTKKQVVWSYDSATQNGNAGKPVDSSGPQARQWQLSRLPRGRRSGA
jgi:hypothetical protein